MGAPGGGVVKKALLYGVGGVFIAIGLFGLLTNTADTHPVGWAVWFGGAAVLHDGLLVPVVLVIGVLTTRIPLPYRRIIQAALAFAGVVTLVALPFVLGYGRHPANASILPLPYTRNLLIILTLITATALIALLLKYRSSR
jgi:hypothetical protein